MRCWKGKYITRADYHVYTEICTSNLNGKKPTMIRLAQEPIRQRLCRENTSDSITNIYLDSGFESQIVIGAWEKYPASFLAFSCILVHILCILVLLIWTYRKIYDKTKKDT